jgi:hypothetical protein
MINEYVVNPSLCAAGGMFVNTYMITMSDMSDMSDNLGELAWVVPAALSALACEGFGVAHHNALAFVLGWCYAPLAVEKMAEVLTHDLTQLSL